MAVKLEKKNGNGWCTASKLHQFASNNKEVFGAAPCNPQLVKTLLQMQLRKLVGEYTFLPSGFHVHGDLPHTTSHLQNLVRGHVTAKK